jgi:hypothetical protein
VASIVIQLFVGSGNAFTQQAVGTADRTGSDRATRKAADSESGIAAPDLIIGPPINGLKTHDLYDSFNELHSGHRHEAIDIMEPEGTPIRAVVDGTIRKLFLSKAGGKTIYEFDESRSYCYLGPERRWWKGVPIDPYPVLERSLPVASRSSPSRPAFTSIYLILEMLHAAS